MRKLRDAVLACGLLAFLLLPSVALGAEKGSIVFCAGFSDSWEPRGVAASFDTPLVSWIAKSGEAYGAQQLSLGIYKIEGAEERLLERRTIEVRPAWNTTGMRNMVLPGKGVFLLALEKKDGTMLCDGKITITGERAASAKAAPKTETLGANLSDLFNKYKPKK